MTQEDKELLLKDLCARLPYGVHCCVLNLNKTIKEDNDIIYGIVGDNIVTLKSDKNECYMYYQIKPYLRQMSSITDGEKEELLEEHRKDERIYIEVIERVANGEKHARGTAVPHFAADWCNEHHFDYRELIKKGLAIAVTNEDNPYK